MGGVGGVAVAGEPQLGRTRLKAAQHTLEAGLGHRHRLMPPEPLHVLALTIGGCRGHPGRCDQVAKVEVGVFARPAVHIDVDQVG